MLSNITRCSEKRIMKLIIITKAEDYTLRFNQRRKTPVGLRFGGRTPK